MMNKKSSNLPKRHKNVISFREFVSMGRPHWRGQDSWVKSAAFFVFGSPDTHTRLRNSYVINAISQLDLPQESQVLEAGCGRAIPSLWLAKKNPEWQLTGMELDPLLTHSLQKVIEHGEYPNVTLIEEDILNLDYEDVFDLIICIDTLEHIEDDVGLLRRFHRALRSGGHLVIHVPRRHQEMWRWIPAFKSHGVVGHVREPDGDGNRARVVIEGHVREEYTADELRLVAEDSGFNVESLYGTIGRFGEISFELNNLFWKNRSIRYPLALLTYPIAIPIGFMDLERDSQERNSLLLTAQKA
jgi:SAM-dependent methyltransferase